MVIANRARNVALCPGAGAELLDGCRTIHVDSCFQAFQLCGTSWGTI